MQVFEGPGQPVDLGTASAADTRRKHHEQGANPFAAIEQTVLENLEQKTVNLRRQPFQIVPHGHIHQT